MQKLKKLEIGILYVVLLLFFLFLSSSSFSQQEQVFISEVSNQNIVSSVITNPTTSQWIIGAGEDVEEFIQVNPIKRSDSLWDFEVWISSGFRDELLNCKNISSNNLAARCVELLNLSSIKGVGKDKQARANLTKIGDRLVGGELKRYPIRNLTNKLSISDLELDILDKNKAVFNVSFNSGFEEGQKFSLGFGSINITSVNSSDLILSGTSATLDLPKAVNNDTSILFWSSATNGFDFDEVAAMCELYNTTQIKCTRDAATAGTRINISLYLAEFANGTTVRRGVGRTPLFNGTFNQFNESQTFFLHGGRTSGDGVGVNDSIIDWCRLLNDTSFECRAGEANQQFSWQLVNMSGIRVQVGNSNNKIGFNVNYGNLTINETNLNRSVVIGTYDVAGNGCTAIRDIVATARFINNTEVRVERADSGDPTCTLIFNSSFYIIEFPQGTKVQSGTLFLSNDQTYANATLNQIRLDRSVAFSSGWNSFGASLGMSNAVQDSTSGARFQLKIENSTTLSVYRYSKLSETFSSGTVHWFVVEFTGATFDFNATLNTTLNFPIEINITQNKTFSINASVYASGGNGHQINGTVYYNQSQSISTLLNTTEGGFSFYNYSVIRNQTCSNFLLNETDCSLNWTINATAPIGTVWNFTINFTSNNTYVAQNGTKTFIVRVRSENTPFYQNNGSSNSNPQRDSDVSFFINWSDDNELSYAFFEHNHGGGYINITVPMNGVFYNVTFNLSITDVPGTIISYRFHANDSANQFNTTPYGTLEVAPDSIDGGSGAAGGGGAQSVIPASERKFSILNPLGSDEITIILFGGRSIEQKFDVLNNGNQSLQVFISCVDVESVLCKYVRINTTQLELGAGQKHESFFNITIPSDIEFEGGLFHIEGKAADKKAILKVHATKRGKLFGTIVTSISNLFTIAYLNVANRRIPFPTILPFFVIPEIFSLFLVGRAKVRFKTLFLLAVVIGVFILGVLLLTLLADTPFISFS